jgi:prepilin-type N-terminal cleavage/methylation domain-containing protein
MMKKGISFIEMIIVIAIIGILSVIAIVSIRSDISIKNLEGIALNISAKLNEFKSYAIAGKDAESYGVKFNNDSYITFKGGTYSSSGNSNVEYQLPEGFSLSNTIPGSDDAIIFSRITGDTGITATITVSSLNGSSTINILVNPLGSVSVIK